MAENNDLEPEPDTSENKEQVKRKFITVTFRTTWPIGILFNLLVDWLLYNGSILITNNIVVACAATLISTAYFGRVFDPIKIKEAHKAVPKILDERQDWIVLGEGFHWLLPKPFMDYSEVSVQIKEKDVPVTEVLSRDNVALEINLALTYLVVDPYIYTNFDKGKPEASYENLAERGTRIYVNQNESEEIPKKTEDMSSDLEKKLDEQAHKWGLATDKALVKTIRLPREIEEARAQVRVEEAQRESENTQNETFMGLMKSMKEEFSGLSDDKIADLVQAERGKVKRIVIDGGAKPIVKAGALAGGHGGDKS